MEAFWEVADQFQAFSGVDLEVELVPSSDYMAKLWTSVAAGVSPCVMELQSTQVSEFAGSGLLFPLDNFPVDNTLDGRLPGTYTYYDGWIYALGAYDTTLVLYARASDLEARDIRIPDADSPWSLQEFDEILDIFSDDYDYALDVNAGWGGEWSMFAYYPLLVSFGGDVINQDGGRPEGVLNGMEALDWGYWFQDLFDRGLVDRNPDNYGFIEGRIPLHYSGTWDLGRYSDAYGDDLLILPPPDLGYGPHTGGGSWQWAIGSDCEYPDFAWQFIEFMMSPESIGLVSSYTGSVPATWSGADQTNDYADGGRWRMIMDYAWRFTVRRPAIPGYSIISQVFDSAVQGIISGEDVQEALDYAVDDLTTVLE